MAYYPTRYYPTRYYAPRYYPATAATVAATFRAALVAALKADATISGIVGARVFPIFQPQTQPTPSVAFQILSDHGEHDILGHAGTNFAMVGFVSRSRRMMECESLHLAVFNLFDSFTGILPGSSVEVLSALHRDEYDEYAASLAADDTGTFELSTIYVFRYRKAAPVR